MGKKVLQFTQNYISWGTYINEPPGCKGRSSIHNCLYVSIDSEVKEERGQLHKWELLYYNSYSSYP